MLRPSDKHQIAAELSDPIDWLQFNVLSFALCFVLVLIVCKSLSLLSDSGSLSRFGMRTVLPPLGMPIPIHIISSALLQ